jgi:lysophospholipase L1-like esterase
MTAVRRVGPLVVAGVILVAVTLRGERHALGLLDVASRKEMTKVESLGGVKQPPSGNLVFRHRILCYGDSLTAGVDLTLDGLYPYAPKLQAMLQQANPNRLYQVFADGHPGKAAEELRNQTTIGPQGSISALLNRVGKEKNSNEAVDIECAPISIMIILIGTVDVNRCEATPEETFNHIRYLHQEALHGGGNNGNDAALTIAIEIPGSSYQLKQPLRGEKAARINKKLAAFGLAADEPRSTFMPFPFAFVSPDEIRSLKEQLGLDKSDSNISTTMQLSTPARFWSDDGIHLSPLGGEELAKALVPVVEEALTRLEKECAPV